MTRDTLREAAQAYLDWFDSPGRAYQRDGSGSRAIAALRAALRASAEAAPLTRYLRASAEAAPGTLDALPDALRLDIPNTERIARANEYDALVAAIRQWSKMYQRAASAEAAPGPLDVGRLRHWMAKTQPGACYGSSTLDSWAESIARLAAAPEEGL